MSNLTDDVLYSRKVLCIDIRNVSSALMIQVRVYFVMAYLNPGNSGLHLYIFNVIIKLNMYFMG